MDGISGGPEKTGKMNLVLRPPTAGGHSRGRNIVRDFIYGCWCNGRRIGGMQMPPLTELYVATVLNRGGFPSSFLEADMQPGEFAELENHEFQSLSSALVMTSTQSFANDVGFLKKLKAANPDCKTILFGSHPTFMPEYCLRDEAVDYIILGEPEVTALELIRHIHEGKSTGELPGIGYVDAAENQKISVARPFVDLDTLPIPDRGLLPKGVDYFNPVIKRAPYTTALTSRGCPFRCIFCTAPAFYGNKTRYRSAASVIEEIGILIGMGYREIFFRDETFTANKKRNNEIYETMLKNKMDFAWIANGRADTVDAEMLSLMKRAGCHMVKFGIESGSDEMLKNYSKATTVEQNRKAISMARKAGLETHAHIVLGGPGETAETLEQTIRFAVKLNPTTATFGILTPYPGTELFDRVAAKCPEIRDGSESTMNNLHTSGFYSSAVCGLDGEYLSSQVKRAYRRFYMRPGYILRRLAGVTSLSGFFRLAIAGSNVLQFALTGEK